MFNLDSAIIITVFSFRRKKQASFFYKEILFVEKTKDVEEFLSEDVRASAYVWRRHVR